eukprot:4761492-Amphidinium_carterae.1
MALYLHSSTFELRCKTAPSSDEANLKQNSYKEKVYISACAVVSQDHKIWTCADFTPIMLPFSKMQPHPCFPVRFVLESVLSEVSRQEKHGI